MAGLSSRTKQLLSIALVAVAFLAVHFYGAGPAPEAPVVAGAHGDSVLDRAIRNRASGVEVEGAGTVTKLLTDDNAGSRHQRFIVRLASGQTVLIAHNIDLAPRIDPLREGDAVSFRGEYEWNAKGGVVHWTHRDPAGRHVDGWLRHNGRTYR